MPAVTASSHGRTAGATVPSLTFSHASDGNPLVVTFITYPAPVSAIVTFNGVPLYLINRTARDGLAYWSYALNAPAVATANIVITPVTSAEIIGGAWSISGGDLDGIVHGFTQNGYAVGTSVSLGVVSAVGDLVIDFCLCQGALANYTVGAGQTKLWAEDGFSDGGLRSASSWEVGAASVAMSWTTSVSAALINCGFSVPANGTVINTVNLSKVAFDAIVQQTAAPAAYTSKVAFDALIQQSGGPAAFLSKVAFDVLLSPTPLSGGASTGAFMGDMPGKVWVE